MDGPSERPTISLIAQESFGNRTGEFFFGSVFFAKRNELAAGETAQNLQSQSPLSMGKSHFI